MNLVEAIDGLTTVAEKLVEDGKRDRRRIENLESRVTSAYILIVGLFLALAVATMMLKAQIG